MWQSLQRQIYKFKVLVTRWLVVLRCVIHCDACVFVLYRNFEKHTLLRTLIMCKNVIKLRIQLITNPIVDNYDWHLDCYWTMLRIEILEGESPEKLILFHPINSCDCNDTFDTRKNVTMLLAPIDSCKLRITTIDLQILYHRIEKSINHASRSN